MKLQEDKLTEIVIDLDKLKQEQINESFLTTFGWLLKGVLKRMFGDSSAPPFKIKGNSTEIDAFSKAIVGEKRYMDAFRKHGLDNPKTFKRSAELKSSINAFERTTGLKWPFE